MHPGSSSATLPANDATGRIGHDAAVSVRGLWWIALACGLASFVLHVLVMRQFEALGVFSQYDVLFDADPNVRINALSFGWPSAETLHPALLNSIHPFFAYYFSPFIWLIYKAATIVGLTEVGSPEVRIAAGLLVLPALTGLQTMAFCGLMFVLRLTPVQAVIMTALGALSFSSLIFGSIPDHFGQTNVAVTAMLLGTACVFRFGMFARDREWFLLGAFAAGITITNVALFGIAHWLMRLYQGGAAVRTTVRSGLLAVGVFVVVLALALALGKVHAVKPAKTLSGAEYVLGFVDVDQVPVLRKVEQAATAIGNAIAPPHPMTRTDPLIANETIDFVFTLKPVAGISSLRNILALLALLGVVFGAFWMLRNGTGAQRPVGGIALAILAFNIVFHSVWGEEHFLYSQHWITAALVLIAGLYAAPGAIRRFVSPVLGAYLLIAAVNNYVVIQGMIRTLEVATATS